MGASVPHEKEIGYLCYERDIEVYLFLEYINFSSAISIIRKLFEKCFYRKMLRILFI